MENKPQDIWVLKMQFLPRSFLGRIKVFLFPETSWKMIGAFKTFSLGKKRVQEIAEKGLLEQNNSVAVAWDIKRWDLEG